MRPFFPVKVYGDKNIPHKKSLIVANHIPSFTKPSFAKIGFCVGRSTVWILFPSSAALWI